MKPPMSPTGPEALAQAVAALQPLTTAADLVDLANASSWSVENVARLYHQVGAAFGFDRLRGAATARSSAATASSVWRFVV
ncbi:hypothetical protein ACRAWD_25790 [Caulobacter segnis]